ncbi:MAG: SET domain-containing protein-lysine N-methyltransferase [Chlamydiota bacterium]
MVKIVRGTIDAVFKYRFNICTPIRYLSDLQIDQSIEKRFWRSWKRFYQRSEPLISDYRQERFEAFFRQLERDGSDERYCRRIEIRFINPKVGFGVFAKEFIPPYSTLNHYAGILMLDREIKSNHDSTFSFTDLKNYSIDAMKAGNWTRFINHGNEKNPKTNAIPWETYLENIGPRIVLTAGPHGIKPREQILYSYGDSYWEGKRKAASL